MNIDERSFLQEVGYRIRGLRADRNLTQAQLADACGLHRTFIGSVERGERNISILNLRLLAKKLRVPIAEVLKDIT